MPGYRGFPSREAYEAHYSDLANYADELHSMREYAQEAERERQEATVTALEQVLAVVKPYNDKIIAEGEANRQRDRAEKLREAIMPFALAYIAKRDPGTSDLDAEQPFHVTVTLGDCRKLVRALSDDRR